MAMTSLSPLMLLAGPEEVPDWIQWRWELDSGDGFRNAWTGIEGRMGRVLIKWQPLEKRA